MKIIRIYWNDAIADSCWTCIEDITNKETPLCTSVGYLVEMTKAHYIITSTITDGHDVMGYTIIPKGLTTKVEYL